MESPQELLALFADNLPDYAILVLDPDGKVLAWNCGAERIHGYRAEEVVGQHFSNFFSPQEEPLAYEALQDAQLRDRAEIEGWHVRRDGSRYWAHEILVPIKNKAGQLRGFAKITRDTTARHQVEEALRQTQEELRAKAESLELADRMKDEFLAMLAHELRNPLAPIANAIALMRLNLEKNAAMALDVAERQLQKMSQLVGDLLDVSRIRRGKIQLQTKPLDLRDAIRDAAASARPLVDTQRQQLVVTLPDEPLWVMGDRVRLEQVFENLLNNAGKYGGRSCRIEIAAERKNGTAVVRVSDNGPGIAPALLPHIFDLFVQSERSLDRSHGGLGIGLTIVRNLVEMHGGQIDVKSEVGAGSEFTMMLPEWIAAEPAPDRAKNSTQSNVRLKILAADDSEDMSETLRLLLESKGHEVEVATCGVDALEAAARLRPHVVFLDIGMPGLDGYQVARRLREQEGMEQVVLVAITGYGKPEDKERSRAAGFDYHLVKPVLLPDLERLLDEIQGLR